MNTKQDFINQGFSVIDSEKTENKLLQFLKEHYPQTIVGNELKIDELKAILGIPVDEKVSGYGLNFVGRNVARAKYAQPTEKELLFNPALSLNPETAQNLVLKGDNLDSLKILKNHYTGKIKCIYIDPPYNTQSDNFVYPDKFDKEEAEVLGIAENLSDEDFARMEFSFSSKKSHNGWLAFMYPRLLLARDLLSQDGVIFISIDDNEQANLKILCDEIFGEENFVGIFTRVTKKGGKSSFATAKNHDYILTYTKNIDLSDLKGIAHNDKGYSNKDEYFEERGFYKLNQTLDYDSLGYVPTLDYPIEINGEIFYAGGSKENYEKRQNGERGRADWGWRWSKDLYDFGYKNGFIEVKRTKNGSRIYTKTYQNVTIKKVENQYQIIKENRTKPLSTLEFTENVYSNDNATKIIDSLIGKGIFEYTKTPELIKKILELSTDNHSEHIILDFFAGSGTTGHAVMALNAEDGGNRKFILCQIDEPIAKNKPAYQFCIDNGLPPVISSITIERLKRASLTLNPSPKERETEGGTPKKEKISNTQNLLSEMPEEALNTKNSHTQTPLPSEGAGGRIGFKVFDSTLSPKLTIEGENILFPELEVDALSRIYNMIFSVGIDEPSQTPEVVQEDSVYRIGNHYYITHSEKVSKEDFAKYLSPENKVFVDGWTASLNATLQHYKEEVKVVF